MFINNISVNANDINLKKNQQKNNYVSDVSFRGDSNGNIPFNPRAAAALLALLTLPGTASGCTNGAPQTPMSTIPNPPSESQPADVEGSTQDMLNQLGGLIDYQTSTSGKLKLNGVGFVSMPVSEFYFTDKSDSVSFHPNEDLPTNAEGAVIVTITPAVSEENIEGNTLYEIVDKVYGDALAAYDEDERVNIQNKLIDEIIQANPELSKYVRAELGDEAVSYESIGTLNLYTGSTSLDQTLDSRMLIMPETVFYEVQGEQLKGQTYCQTTYNYTPAFTSASIIKDSDDLLEGEYSSMSDMIHAAYGEDLSDEAYRDILYSIVNSPVNAPLFETTLGKMNFNNAESTQ